MAELSSRRELQLACISCINHQPRRGNQFLSCRRNQKEINLVEETLSRMGNLSYIIQETGRTSPYLTAAPERWLQRQLLRS